MDAARLARTAAVATVVIWGLKALAIWAAGGLGESPFEGPLFFLGLLALLVTGASLGVALTRGRPTPVRVGAGVVGLLAAGAVGSLADAVAGAVVPESAGWVEAEAGLWLTALVFLALAFLLLRPRPAPAA